MRVVSLLLVAACAQPVAPVAGRPAAPVLEAVAEEQHRRIFSLRGMAEAELVVRIFTDCACAGPVYLQTTGAGLQAGAKVELIPGQDNLFSANAVSAQGLSSDCSAPVRLQYLAAKKPGRPSIFVEPVSPSREFAFHVRGASDPGTVRLYDGTCTGPVLAQLSAAEFFSPGFAVQLAANERRRVAIEAVNEDTVSDCVEETVINDLTPPSVTVRLSSPTPSPQYSAYVVFGGDADEVDVSLDANCTRPVFQPCRGCSTLVVGFPSGVSTFSALGRDRAGNTVCVRAPQPWVQDSSLPEDEAMVLFPPSSPGGFWTMRVEVAANRLAASLFQSADCSGPSQGWQPSDIVPAVYLSGAATGGPLSMRSFRFDGGEDPCSNSVTWQ